MFFYTISIGLFFYFFFSRKFNFFFFNLIFFFLITFNMLNISNSFLLKSGFINPTPIFWNILNFLNDSNWSFLVIFCIYIYIYKVSSFLPHLLITVILMCNNNVLVTSIYNIYLLNSFLNSTLFNGLLLIHPIYLYIAYSFLIFLFTLVKLLFYFYKNNKYLFILTKLSVLIKTNFLYSSIALVLGSLWAQQELNWGGWWNWDSIELIAFSVSILLCIFLHSNNTFIYKYLLVYRFFLTQLIFFFYLLSRLDILSSIHSFVVSSNSQNWYEFKLCILYTIYVFIISFYRLSFKTTTIEKKKKFFFIKFFFISIFFYIILLLLLFSIKNIVSSSVYITESKSIKYIIYTMFIIFFYYHNTVFFDLKNLRFSIFFICFLFLQNFNFTETFFIIFTIFLFDRYFNKILIKIIHLFFIIITIYILIFSCIEVFCFLKYKLHNYNNSLYYIFSNNQYNSNYTTILFKSDFFFYKIANYQYKNINFINPFSLVKNTIAQFITTNNYFNLNSIFFKKLFIFGQFYIVYILYMYIFCSLFIYFYSKPNLCKVV